MRRGSNWYKESDTCADYHPAHGFVKKCPFRQMQQEAKKLKKKFQLPFHEFASCPGNKANNRQTRMLANLTDLHCDEVNSTTYMKIQSNMLQSAKANLLKLAFFGLTDYQKETQLLFEETFQIHFRVQFEQHTGISEKQVHNLTQEQIRKIYDLNQLDVDLYQLGKSVFFRRIKEMELY